MPMTICENCGGEGGWPHYPDEYVEGWISCPQCGGLGRVEGEGEPIDIDDLPPPRIEVSEP